jgi:nicotinamidase-related amidase
MKLDPKKTAFVTLDFQSGILGFCPDAAGAVSVAARAVEFARENHFLLIHVGLGFTDGHPEIPDFESPFLMAKKNGLFVKGTLSAEFLPSIAKPGETVVHKQRVGAFSENHLDLLLRSRGIEHLVLFGLTTSGIVLSTLRRAFDLNYRSVVLQDACFDRDPEVHRVLTEKVFPAQAAVRTVEAFIAEQSA